MLNPIEKIIYHTPNYETQEWLSEFLDNLWSQIRNKFGKDKIEVVTNANSAKIEIVFKNGIIREVNMKYARLIKHILENNTSSIDQDTSEWLATLYI